MNASKVIVNKVLYEENNISQRSRYQYYLDRAKIEGANKVAERNIKYSPIQTPLIINPEISQLENQEYTLEDLEQNIQGLDDLTHLALLKRNRHSDSSDEDRQSRNDAKQRLKNAKLFEDIREKQLEKTIIEEITKYLDTGAEINALNTRGKTVLHIAVEKNYKGCS
ncbi:hypothetical protein [Rickettsia argasii]|uniref:Uncharacterized protein n=1 Tax=Rickettsia argasii T170-B TaxID=1268837 RepID=A0A0F3RGF7_9RICK|nr:hypothetical protein [Rickettsia argasii]KJW04264.1 hypothetical protein RAT170B_1408 [Rickettsia argasii T170-B]